MGANVEELWLQPSSLYPGMAGSGNTPVWASKDTPTVSVYLLFGGNAPFSTLPLVRVTERASRVIVKELGFHRAYRNTVSSVNPSNSPIIAHWSVNVTVVSP